MSTRSGYCLKAVLPLSSPFTIPMTDDHSPSSVSARMNECLKLGCGERGGRGECLGLDLHGRRSARSFNSRQSHFSKSYRLFRENIIGTRFRETHAAGRVIKTDVARAIPVNRRTRQFASPTLPIACSRQTGCIICAIQHGQAKLPVGRSVDVLS
jgi:hypothetical protein